MMSKPSNVLKLQINSNKSLFKQLYVFSSWGWVNWLLRVWSRDCYSWWCLSFFPFWLLLVCLVVLSYVMNFILGAKYVLLLYSCFMLQKCKEHWRTLPPCWFLLVILFLWEFDNFDDVQRFLKSHTDPFESSYIWKLAVKSEGNLRLLKHIVPHKSILPALILVSLLLAVIASLL